MLSLISKAAFAILKLDEFTDPADTHCNSGDSNKTQDEDLSKWVLQRLVYWRQIATTVCIKVSKWKSFIDY